LGGELPVVSIGYEVPSSARDSGFTLVFSDARPEGLADVEIAWVCLGCLLWELPAEVGRGLGIVREYGVADLDKRAVVVGDLIRLESD